MTRLAEKGGVDNPTYLSVHEGNRCVYANSEVFGWNEGTVSAYRLDPTTGSLSYLNKQPALGSILAHNSLDRTGRFVLVANYSVYAEPEDTLPDQAVVVMPIRQDGGLGPPVSSHSHSGSGPNADRQERSHAHCALASPDNRHVLVADLGIDQLVVYRFDAASGALSPAPTSFSDEAGSGTPALRLPPLEPLCLRDQRAQFDDRGPRVRRGVRRSLPPCRRSPRCLPDIVTRAIARACN